MLINVRKINGSAQNLHVRPGLVVYTFSSSTPEAEQADSCKYEASSVYTLDPVSEKYI